MQRYYAIRLNDQMYIIWFYFYDAGEVIQILIVIVKIYKQYYSIIGL